MIFLGFDFGFQKDVRVVLESFYFVIFFKDEFNYFGKFGLSF